MRPRPVLLVYLAARYQDRAAMREMRAALEAVRIGVTSHWIDSVEDDVLGTVQARRAASADLADIDAADVLVFVNPKSTHKSGQGGRHTELGYALGKGKRIILVGDRENVFHWLPDVELVPAEQLVAALFAVAYNTQ